MCLSAGVKSINFFVPSRLHKEKMKQSDWLNLSVVDSLSKFKGSSPGGCEHDLHGSISGVSFD